MTVLLITNVGNRDVWIDKNAPIPGEAHPAWNKNASRRALGEALQRDWTACQSHLALPIIGKAVQYARERSGALDGVVLIASDQSGSQDVADVHRQQDTCELVPVVSRLLAEQHGIERIRVAADRFLFLAGSEKDTDGSDDALEFAAGLTAEIVQFRELNNLSLTVHVGVSTGPVATGVLDSGSLTFGAWGEPVRRALAIGALSRSEEILVDTSTAASASDPWIMETASHIVDLNDEPMSLFTLQIDMSASPATG